MREVNRNEIRRYLGYRKIEPDEEICRMIEECLAELQEKCVPRSIYQEYPIERKEEGMTIAGVKIPGVHLARNLQDCTHAVMMACTIGPQADMLTRRASVLSAARGAVYQACGAAFVEAYCDEINEEIMQDAKERGFYTRPRYSPGYGDLSLDLQKDFSRILDMPKTIGVTLTDSLLMVPSKSVTAYIGLSPIDKEVNSGCETCESRDTCEYRNGETR